MSTPLPPLPLPPGIRSRMLPGINGLDMHLLEAGEPVPGRLPVLLLHGFPELAYSWRKLMPALAAAGHHVLAPDLRGYGRTTGWDRRYEGDLGSFRFLNLVRDCLALLHALGIEAVNVVGHDFGSPLAAWCALVRPDVFRSLVLMSAPFGGPAPLAASTGAAPAARPLAAAQAGASRPVPSEAATRMDTALGELKPPRKHYQWYYATRRADADMRLCPQGVHDFLRAYYHHKSADWPGNQPFELAAWSASELAKLPTYYVMDRDLDMPATVAPHMPSAAAIAACRWLPDDELRVYSGEYTRTGFQGGLQWYRCGITTIQQAELQTFAGRRIEVPAMFIAGAQDWGIHQRPGELRRMAESGCARFEGVHLVPGAGHWVQQEQPEAVSALLRDFLGRRAG
ncbi:MAG: alpha/beta hydrolase [Burkholderiales bacterium]